MYVDHFYLLYFPKLIKSFECIFLFNSKEVKYIEKRMNFSVKKKRRDINRKLLLRFPIFVKHLHKYF